MGLLACGAPTFEGRRAGPEGPTSLEEAPFSERLAFGPDGLTEVLEIPPSQGEALAIWLRASDDVCFSIAGLVDGAGAAAPRSANARRAALLSLYDEGDFSPSRGVSLQLSLRNCETTGSARPEGPITVEVGWASREHIPERGTLGLRLVISPHSELFGRADLQGELMAHVVGEMSEAGIDATLVAVVELGAGVPEEVTGWSLETDELAMVRALAGPSLRGSVDVIFVGCLRHDDPFPGPPVAIDGFTPRVTGGSAAPADAIYLPGMRCDALSPDFRADRIGHTIAHELGHFLGLEHTVEADGSTDTLEDTDAANIMNFNPALSIAHGFSVAQARAMRAHPWVGP